MCAAVDPLFERDWTVKSNARVIQTNALARHARRTAILRFQASNVVPHADDTDPPSESAKKVQRDSPWRHLPMLQRRWPQVLPYCPNDEELEEIEAKEKSASHRSARLPPCVCGKFAA